MKVSINNPTNPEQWLSLYGDYLFTLAMLKTKKREVAEDLVQDTFLSAIKSIDKFKGNSTEKTWLVSILNHKIIDYYRKNDVLKNVTDYLDQTDETFNDHYFGATKGFSGHWKQESAPLPWGKGTDDEINRDEFYKILDVCLSKMPAKLMPVFISKFIDEKDSDEIRKEFDLTSSNYWVIIHRSKLLMRECLEKNWFAR